MKFLHIQDLYFKLPDDFQGGLDAALRALADYHEQVAGTPKQVIDGPDAVDMEKMTMAEAREKMWGEFWKEIHGPMKRRVAGSANIVQYRQADGEGTLSGLDINTGDAKNEL